MPRLLWKYWSTLCIIVDTIYLLRSLHILFHTTSHDMTMIMEIINKVENGGGKVGHKGKGIPIELGQV